MGDVEIPASAKDLYKDEQAAPTTTEGGGAEPAVTVHGVSISRTQLPLFIVFVASIVLLIATGSIYRWSLSGGYAGYAISVPCIALIISFVGLLLTKFAEDTYLKVGRFMNMACFLYSFVGACFLTLSKPFTGTGNGYFAAWALVYGSAATLGVTANALGNATKGMGSLMGLLASAVVVLLSAIPAAGDGGWGTGGAVFALVVACVTILFVVFVVGKARTTDAPALGPGPYFVALVTLAAFWIVMACVTTFQGPFLMTGNGYFASWAGAGMVSMAANVARHDM